MNDPTKPAAPQHVNFNTLAAQQITAGNLRQVATGAQATIARIALRKGEIVPGHTHTNEQITYVISGALKLTAADSETVLRAGEVMIIPSNAHHVAEALEDTVTLDIFAPIRKEWIQVSQG